MNSTLLILLRTIHIFAGVLWVGSAVFYLFFIEPTVKSLGPIGPKFMQNLAEERRFPIYMGMISLLTVLAGAILFWNTSGGLQVGWIKTGPGIGFTIGSLIGIAVYFVGTFMIRPRAERMGALGKEIGMAGGPPNPAQLAEMQKLDRELTTIERIDFVMLTLSLLTMATARYWSF